MNESEHAVVIFGTRGSSEAYAIRDFLHRCGIRFQWIELGDDEQARSQAQVTGLNDNRLPICVFPDGSRMQHPTVRQITEKLGWFLHPSRSEHLRRWTSGFERGGVWGFRRPEDRAG